ncbi:MAG: DUF3014 domain-containing protein [Nevskiales bacterium]
MGKGIWASLVVGTAIAAGVVYWRYGAFWVPKPTPPAGVASPAAQAPPPILHPVPVSSATPQEPLPALEQSDAPLHTRLVEIVGNAPIETYLIPDQIIQRAVAAVDSLDRAPPPLRRWPVTPLGGLPLVDAVDDRLFLTRANAARYEPAISVIATLDARRVAALYLRWYPLFQQAYQELGYPTRYFNDRLIDVIDHLLAAPEIEGPIPLVRPKILYRYADPALEKRSWGQKTLVRMGPANAAIVKQKLREFREVIASPARQ